MGSNTSKTSKEEGVTHKNELDICDNPDPRSPTPEITRTPLQNKTGSKHHITKNVDLRKTFENTNGEEKLVHNDPRTPIVAAKIEGDSNEGNVEDEDKSKTPKKAKSESFSDYKTPSSCMKNKADVGYTRSKSVNTLYDPKNQQTGLSKIPKRVSHIPRLKCLSTQTKIVPAISSISLKNMSKTAAISGDCENTPPHSYRDRWDKD